MEKAAKPLPDAPWKRCMWLFCEEPTSSRPAKAFALFSITCIMVSIVSFCMETLPAFERPICLNVTTDGGESFHQQPNYRDHVRVLA